MEDIVEEDAAVMITRIDQVSTAWLTAVLLRSGALTRGVVADFDVDVGSGCRALWQGDA